MDVNEITLPKKQIVRLATPRPLIQSKQHFIERTVIMLTNSTIKVTMKKSQTGFTLIDLVVTISVIAFVAAIGTAGFKKFIEANLSASQNNLIVGTLSDARVEAIKRGTRVVACGSTNGTACDTTNWESGWIVFTDMDSNGAFNPPPVGTDTLLGVNTSLKGGIKLRTVNNAGAVIFLPNGALGPSGVAVNDTFQICTQDAVANPKLARAVNILISGLITVAKDTDSNGTVNDINGNDVVCP